MTDTPDFDPRIHFASHPDFGRVVRMIRADAPELVALIELVRDCIETNSEFQLQWDRDAIAALAAWDAMK